MHKLTSLMTAAVATLVLAPPATALTLQQTPEKILVVGTDDAEQIDARPSGPFVFFQAGPGTPLTGTGCIKVEGTLWRCTGEAVDLQMAGGSDVVTVSGASPKKFHLGGGPGDDDLKADGTAVTYDGGTGDDRLKVHSSTGDIIVGGPGVDNADYSAGAPVPRSLHLNQKADDGVAGEADNISADIEVLTGGPGPDTIWGSDGTDLIRGAAGDDSIRGWSGDDRIIGGPGKDTIKGDNGDDLIDEGPDSEAELLGHAAGDRIDGGNGADTVSYAQRKKSVAVSNNDTHGDGAENEGDSVSRETEHLVGGLGNDELKAGTWSYDSSRLTGGPGDDKLIGSYGGDLLFGGPGADLLEDTLGKNELHGGTGDDWLTGGGGRSLLFGDAGNDVARAKDKKAGDEVNCGGGVDFVEVDAKDVVKKNCDKDRSLKGVSGLKGYRPGWVYRDGKWNNRAISG